MEPAFKVVLISRFKQMEVLSEHEWWLGAFLCAVMFSIVYDGAEQRVEIF